MQHGSYIMFRPRNYTPQQGIPDCHTVSPLLWNWPTHDGLISLCSKIHLCPLDHILEKGVVQENQTRPLLNELISYIFTLLYIVNATQKLRIREMDRNHFNTSRFGTGQTSRCRNTQVKQSHLGQRLHTSQDI